MSFRQIIVLFIGFVAALASLIRAETPPSADAAPAPFTVLFDTAGTSASPLAADTLAARKGWVAVPEDNLTHAFTGDAVFMNDRVAVVIRSKSAGAEMYSRSGQTFALRATLAPIGADSADGTLSSIKIIENGQASVMIETAFVSAKGLGMSLRFRLSAGEALLDIRGAKGAARLRVIEQAKYVIVPDFFADDMLFDAASQQNPRTGLPAENCVLGLADEGRAIIACVWPSSQQNSDMVIADRGSSKASANVEIDLPENGRLWTAVIEGTGVWHAQRVKAQQNSGSELALDWKPPMPARWRADVLAENGETLSAAFPDEDGTTPHMAHRETLCRFDAGRALVQMKPLAPGIDSRLIVVYPIDRTRTTPLTAFCLVDIMRNALGVGPCQYVLDTERIGTAENSTPEPVTHWVQKQFEKKPSKRDADAIREQLANMTQQVKRTEARIADYVAFGQKVKQLCAESSTIPESAAIAARLSAIAATMSAPPTSFAAYMEKHAEEIAVQAEQPDALTKTQAAVNAIRDADVAQEYALAKLRMAARQLKQECRTIESTEPKVKSFAERIQQQAEQMLVRK